MDSTVLVTGGTGTIGRRVVRLLAPTRSLRILSRHPGDPAPGIEQVRGDVVKGTGLAESMGGIDTVLHLAGGARGDDVAARRLVGAAREAGVRHLVLISVIGADRMPIGYFRRKALAEHELVGSGVPWTILRSAQLHDFVLPVARTLSTLRLAPRGLRFEPVDVDEVAGRLAELTLGAPAGRVPDLAGPEVLDAAGLVRTYNEVLGRPGRRVHGIGLPGAAGRAYRAGDNLTEVAAPRGRGTWRSFLEAMALARAA
ncbi:NAD(P)H-binding protein [Nakamurella sp. YIM 132087]|uniref:NAD(P)H-binding protein n=1 Tax=Nakamurella alba TaxID=2665158 RepID=A0A7K1FI90_9ACTN|nr:NAD(P)H-binding protein [Nakamurella alba]MTD12604.1 NAD(P)H-binding protein [Nakamurella alba]